MKRMNKNTGIWIYVFFMGCSFALYAMEENNDDHAFAEKLARLLLSEKKGESDDSIGAFIETWVSTIVREALSLKPTQDPMINQEQGVEEDSKKGSAKEEENHNQACLSPSESESSQLLSDLYLCNIEAIKKLLASPAINANCLLTDGSLALPLLALPIWQNNKKVVHLFLLAKANPYLRSDLGISPIEYAIFSFPDRIEVIQELLKNTELNLKHINDKNHRGYTLLHLAIILEAQKIVKLLVSAGADPYIEDPNGRNAFKLGEQSDEIKSILFSVVKEKTSIIQHSQQENTMVNKLSIVGKVVPLFHLIVFLLVIEYVVGFVYGSS